MPFRYVATFLRNERGASPARQSPESADGYPQKLWMTARRPIAGGVGRAVGGRRPPTARPGRLLRRRVGQRRGAGRGFAGRRAAARAGRGGTSGAERSRKHAAGGFSGRVRSVSPARRSGRLG